MAVERSTANGESRGKA